MSNDEEKRDRHGESEGRSPDRKKTFGELVRERALLAAPTIVIVYPLVGWFLGWLTVKYWQWPYWVPILTMVAALVQAILELVKLSKHIYNNNSN